MRRNDLVLGATLFMALAYPCWNVCAQTLKYQPQVGEAIVFGIDCIVKPSFPGQPTRTHRVRLSITPTSLGDEHWQADFSTVPVTSVGPLYTVHPVMDPRDIPVPPGEPAFAAEIRTRNLQSQVESYKQQVAERAMLPGLVTPVKGVLTVGYDGKVKEADTVTAMPLMLGPVETIPLSILPADESKTSYSSKHYLVWSGRDESEKLPEAWLINAWTIEDKKDGLVPIKRSVEFASGDDSKLKLDLSGDGTVLFNPDRGLAQSGVFQFKSNQSIYRGLVDKYQMQVAFQLLNDWQLVLFDHFLVPNEKALDKENLLRLTDKQSSYLSTFLADGKPDSRLNAYNVNSLQMNAPAPVDSKLYQVMQQEVKKSKSNASGRRNWHINNIIIALSRWERVRKLGTVVPRTWKAAAGSFQIKARMVSADETTVLLKREDNQQEIKVPLEKLSADDQEFVEIFGKSPSESP